MSVGPFTASRKRTSLSASEISELCGYGRPQGDETAYSARRFRTALAELEASPKVTRRGDRWYTSTSPGLRTTEERAEDGTARPCAREGCEASLTRANALYCSKRCRDRDYRYGPKRGRIPGAIERNAGRSEAVPEATFSSVGYLASSQ